MSKVRENLSRKDRCLATAKGLHHLQIGIGIALCVLAIAKVDVLFLPWRHQQIAVGIALIALAATALLYLAMADRESRKMTNSDHEKTTAP